MTLVARNGTDLPDASFADDERSSDATACSQLCTLPPYCRLQFTECSRRRLLLCLTEVAPFLLLPVIRHGCELQLCPVSSAAMRSHHARPRFAVSLARFDVLCPNSTKFKCDSCPPVSSPLLTRRHRNFARRTAMVSSTSMQQPASKEACACGKLLIKRSYHCRLCCIASSIEGDANNKTNTQKCTQQTGVRAATVDSAD